MKVRIGTRGSRLALAQSRMVAAMLARHGHESELVVIKTAGDQDRDRPFAEVGAPGVFVREIETALVEERVDLAVHSYKDLPSKSPDRLVVAAVPERVDVADRILVRAAAAVPGRTPLPLVEGASVGSASARRRALLAYLRPDVRVELLRGNLPTRVRRVVAGDFDATLLAAAGLTRLDREAERDPGQKLDREGIHEARLDPAVFIPAPSQGAVAVQVRRDDPGALAAAREIDDTAAHRAVGAERALLVRVEGGCQVPFGAWCHALPGGGLVLKSFLERNGKMVFAEGEGSDPDELAAQVWAVLESGVGGGEKGAPRH
jgi:hydroxymethylbilane synthase